MRNPLLLAVLAALLLAGCATDAPVEADPTVPPLHPSIDGYPDALVTLEGPDAAVEEVAVKVAATEARRKHGLMEVEELPAGTGMLFVFDEERQGAFWMKDTLVPLSIAFASSDGDILEILQMEPCESEPCPLYDPRVTYRYALEVPAGWFDDVGVDDRWTLELPTDLDRG